MTGLEGREPSPRSSCISGRTSPSPSGASITPASRPCGTVAPHAKWTHRPMPVRSASSGSVARRTALVFRSAMFVSQPARQRRRMKATS